VSRNWSKYNKSLVNRGSLTLWIHKDIDKSWKAKRVKKLGRPFQFSDSAIETALAVRFTFGLSLRSLEGFLGSLFNLLKLPLKVPCYTQICKRMKSLDLPHHFRTKKKIKHIVLDGSGLKMFGEGESKVKKHGAGKRREWRKLHLAVDESTQEVVFAELTGEKTHDTHFIPELFDRKGLKRLLVDGVADSEKLYKMAFEQGIDLLTPPQRNGRIKKEPWMKQRNNRILEILGLGGDKIAKSIWGKLRGYSKRVTIESAIARWKKLFGQHLRSLSFETQRIEISVKAQILNDNEAVGGRNLVVSS